MNAFLRRISFFVTVAVLCGILSGCRKEELPAEAVFPPDYTLLTVGLDDAAENSDVMFLLRLSPSRGEATVLQIPRDTLCADGNGVCKINHWFPSFRAAGATEAEALGQLKEKLSETLGIRADAAVALTTGAFRSVVDALGGVTVSLPDGEIFLPDGESAERFIRFRKGYATGDLGRLDAQKQFLSGLVAGLREKAGASFLLRLLCRCYRDVVTDLTFSDAVTLFLRYGEAVKDLSVAYVTLPGEAAFSDGISYYVLNRKNAADLLAKTGISEGGQSSLAAFCPPESTGLRGLFFSEETSVRIYSEDSLTGLRIPKKDPGK